MTPRPRPEGAPAAFSEERAALYLAALATPGMGVRRLRLLHDAFGGLEAAAGAPPARLRAVEGVPAPVTAALAKTLKQAGPRALRQVRAAVGAGLGVFTWEDAGYPPPLHDDPIGCAPVLFVEGALPPQLHYSSRDVRACAVVGTRAPAAPSLAFTRDLARALAREGVLVVSGLALGIDGAAHEGALEALRNAPPAAGAPVPRVSQRRYRWGAATAPTPRPAGTLAVLGGGHGRLHPAANAGLARRILASGGAIVSEWPPDVSPRRHTFLRRNRVISGLSRVVAVIEAGERSGTNNTVEHALEQGRTVMVVPAAPWTQINRGCFRHLRDGALVLLDESDVLQQFPELVARSGGELAAELAGGGEQPALALGGPEELVRHLLGASAELPLDALVARLRLPAGALLALLARLELTGEVEATPSGRYRLRGRR